jgi:hypothetical protein
VQNWLEPSPVPMSLENKGIDWRKCRVLAHPSRYFLGTTRETLTTSGLFLALKENILCASIPRELLGKSQKHTNISGLVIAAEITVAFYQITQSLER